MSKKNLPRIIITGASGFIGRNLLNLLKEDFFIYAFARRTQQEAGVSRHVNVEWILVDIANRSQVAGVMQNIRSQGNVDYLFHLAAYFDFANEPNPEYERTNVTGTAFILEEAASLGLKRFIFASSIVVSDFPSDGEVLSEKSPANAQFPYAITKAKGEAMVKEYSKKFPCSIVRFAAVFSDWCEYGPLYKFFDTWFSGSWNSRILGGKGKSAVPYIHIYCLNRLLLRIIKTSDELPDYDIYIASPGKALSHTELYKLSTRLYFGEQVKAVYMPRYLARIGVWLRDKLGILVGKRPFERPWMMKYIDQRMDVDASYTYKSLKWEETPRYNLSRRLLYLIEHLKAFPLEWHQKNALALIKSPERPNLKIAEILGAMNEELVAHIHSSILNSSNAEIFPHYQQMDPDKLKWYLGILYDLLMVSVRTGDRLAMVNYARFIASIRIREGFSFHEISSVYQNFSQYIIERLLEQKELQGLESRIQDVIALTVQMAIDEIEDAFENIPQPEELVFNISDS